VYHRGVWCRKESSKDETVAPVHRASPSSFSSPLSPPRHSRRLYRTPPRFLRPSVTALVVATLFSGEIPRSAIYIFDVASSTPLMLLVRNLPLTCVPRCSFALRFPPPSYIPFAIRWQLLCSFSRNVTVHVWRTA